MQYEKNLKRNYIKDPLKYGECPLYEDLYFLYITCNLTYKEIAPYFNAKVSTIRRYIKKLNIVKSTAQKVETIKRITYEKYGDTSYSRIQEYKDKYKATCLKKYGVDNPNKIKAIREKIEKTNIEKYGFKVASKNNEVKEKARQTFQNKYGRDYFVCTDEFKEKCKDTCLRKYNSEFAIQNEIVKEKVKQSNLNRFNVPWVLMNNEIKQKSIETNLKKFGTTNISTAHIPTDNLKIFNDPELLLEYIKQFEVQDLNEIANSLGVSYDGLVKKLHQLQIWDKIEHKINIGETQLKSLFPEFEKTRQILKPYEIDLFNPNLNLGIEFNGTYWHSEIFKTSTYHQDKSILAKNKNIFLYHIFEYEWKDPRKKSIIISQLNNLTHKNSLKIGARKCNIQELPNNICQTFLNTNHLQGKDQSSIRLGLIFQDELISVMTFCRPRFSKKYQWELSRFCNCKNTTIIGGASKLFNYFITTYNPKSIISYSNFAKTRGTIYSTLGFKFEKLTNPNYVWFNHRETLSRYQCQKHKLTEFKDFGTTENEIMHNRGFLKLYDCGNYVWSWFSK